MKFRTVARTVAFAIALAVLLSLLSACLGREAPSASLVLSEMLAFEKDCPAGTVYLASAGEGETGYFSESFCAALYGDGEVPAEWASVVDFAIFQSASPSPAELAVFRAIGRAEAEEVAEMCVRRLSVLRRFYRGTDLESYTSGGRVVILGRYVVMAVSSDAETAVEEARAALR